MPTDAKFRALLVNKDGERQSLAITELAEAAPIWQPPDLGAGNRRTLVVAPKANPTSPQPA